VHYPEAKDQHLVLLKEIQVRIRSRSFPPRPDDYPRGKISNAWIREQLLQQYFRHHHILCLPQ
jgi:hypothetical protein